MALADRLISDGPDKIGVHQFMAAMAELIRGQVSRADVIAFFEMSGTDITQLDALIAKGQAMSVAERFKYALELHDVLLLAEAGHRYTTVGELRARLDI